MVRKLSVNQIQDAQARISERSRAAREGIEALQQGHSDLQLKWALGRLTDEELEASTSELRCLEAIVAEDFSPILAKFDVRLAELAEQGRQKAIRESILQQQQSFATSWNGWLAGYVSPNQYEIAELRQGAIASNISSLTLERFRNGAREYCAGINKMTFGEFIGFKRYTPDSQ